MARKYKRKGRFRKRRGAKRRRKSYSARLKDKKINTGVERAALRIARSETQKAQQYYIDRGVYLNSALVPAPTWPANDTWPTMADSVVLLQGQMYVREFAEIGGYLASDLSLDVSGIPGGPAPVNQDFARNLKLHIKSLVVKFRVMNQGLSTARLNMAIFRVPYNKSFLATQAVPNDWVNPYPQFSWMPPMTTCYNLTSETRREYKVSGVAGSLSSITFQSIATSSHSLPIQKMIDDPGAGGAANRVNTEPFKFCSVSKSYKGLGKGEDYELVPVNIGPINLRGRLSRCRYFFAIRADQNITFHGVSAVRFCRGKNVPDQVIFDTLATGAQ